MGSMSIFTRECPREWVSPTDLSCFTDSVTKHTSVGALIHRQQTICWISAQTKLTSIYRHKLIVIYCAVMKYQALLTIQAKFKLAIKLIIFLLFGRDTIWRIPRKRMARGGNFEVLKRCYIQIYPESCYSSTHVKLGVM